MGYERTSIAAYFLNGERKYEKESLPQTHKKGVDNHYKKRAILTALLLSMLFCWGNEISATTHENDKIMVNGALYQKLQDMKILL